MSNTPRKAPSEEEGTAFDLTGLAKLAEEKFNVDTGAGPEADAAEALADADRLAEEELKKGAGDGQKTTEESEAEAEAAIAASGKTDAEKAADLFKKADEDAAKAAADAEKAEADAKAAEEAAKAEELAKGRDADLSKLEAETVHMRPSQKKAWTEIKSAAQKARDEAAAAKAEADAAKARVAELEASKPATVVPKEIEEQMGQLRERVRELDAERDPDIVKKYDTPIKANEDRVVAILKQFQFDKKADKDGNITGDNPDAIPQLLARGISFKTLAPQIAALEKAGEMDAAQAIRRAIDRNIDLREARTEEVKAIKGDIEARVKARTEQGTVTQKQTADAVIAEANRIYTADVGDMTKKHPFLLKPAEPLATDTPAVVASKKAAIAEYNKIEEKIGGIATSINSNGKSGQDYVKAEAQRTSLAIQSVIIKERVLPVLEARAAKAEARVKELEAELGKVKTAGGISRAHGAAAQAGKGGKPVDPNLPLAEAMAEHFRQQGVAVNT